MANTIYRDDDVTISESTTVQSYCSQDEESYTSSNESSIIYSADGAQGDRCAIGCRGSPATWRRHKQLYNMIANQETKNAHLKQEEEGARRRFEMMELVMPALVARDILRSRDKPDFDISRFLEEKFQGVELGGLQCSPQESDRVRELEAEKKRALARLEEARVMWCEKKKCLERVKRERDEVSRVNEELECKIDNLILQLKEKKEKERTREDDCTDFRCRELRIGDSASATSITSAGLECIIKLQEVAEETLCMKRKIVDLERRECDYLQTLQCAGQLLSKVSSAGVESDGGCVEKWREKDDDEASDQEYSTCPEDNDDWSGTETGCDCAKGCCNVERKVSEQKRICFKEPLCCAKFSVVTAQEDPTLLRWEGWSGFEKGYPGDGAMGDGQVQVPKEDLEFWLDVAGEMHRVVSNCSDAEPIEDEIDRMGKEISKHLRLKWSERRRSRLQHGEAPSSDESKTKHPRKRKYSSPEASSRDDQNGKDSAEKPDRESKMSTEEESGDSREKHKRSKEKEMKDESVSTADEHSSRKEKDSEISTNGDHPKTRDSSTTMEEDDEGNIPRKSRKKDRGRDSRDEKTGRRSKDSGQITNGEESAKEDKSMDEDEVTKTDERENEIESSESGHKSKRSKSSGGSIEHKQSPEVSPRTMKDQPSPRVKSKKSKSSSKSSRQESYNILDSEDFRPRKKSRSITSSDEHKVSPERDRDAKVRDVVDEELHSPESSGMQKLSYSQSSQTSSKSKSSSKVKITPKPSEPKISKMSTVLEKIDEFEESKTGDLEELQSPESSGISKPLQYNQFPEVEPLSRDIPLQPERLSMTGYYEALREDTLAKYAMEPNKIITRKSLESTTADLISLKHHSPSEIANNLPSYPQLSKTDFETPGPSKQKISSSAKYATEPDKTTNRKTLEPAADLTSLEHFSPSELSKNLPTHSQLSKTDFETPGPSMQKIASSAKYSTKPELSTKRPSLVSPTTDVTSLKPPSLPGPSNKTFPSSAKYSTEPDKTISRKSLEPLIADLTSLEHFSPSELSKNLVTPSRISKIDFETPGPSELSKNLVTPSRISKIDVETPGPSSQKISGSAKYSTEPDKAISRKSLEPLIADLTSLEHFSPSEKLSVKRHSLETPIITSSFETQGPSSPKLSSSAKYSTEPELSTKRHSLKSPTPDLTSLKHLSSSSESPVPSVQKISSSAKYSTEHEVSTKRESLESRSTDLSSSKHLSSPGPSTQTFPSSAKYSTEPATVTDGHSREPTPADSTHLKLSSSSGPILSSYSEKILIGSPGHSDRKISITAEYATEPDKTTKGYSRGPTTDSIHLKYSSSSEPVKSISSYSGKHVMDFETAGPSERKFSRTTEYVTEPDIRDINLLESPTADVTSLKHSLSSEPDKSLSSASRKNVIDLEVPCLLERTISKSRSKTEYTECINDYQDECFPSSKSKKFGTALFGKTEVPCLLERRISKTRSKTEYTECINDYQDECFPSSASKKFETALFGKTEVPCLLQRKISKTLSKAEYTECVNDYQDECFPTSTSKKFETTLLDKIEVPCLLERKISKSRPKCEIKDECINDYQDECYPTSTSKKCETVLLGKFFKPSRFTKSERPCVEREKPPHSSATFKESCSVGSISQLIESMERANSQLRKSIRKNETQSLLKDLGIPERKKSQIKDDNIPRPKVLASAFIGGEKKSAKHLQARLPEKAALPRVKTHFVIGADIPLSQVRHLLDENQLDQILTNQSKTGSRRPYGQMTMRDSLLISSESES